MLKERKFAVDKGAAVESALLKYSGGNSVCSPCVVISQTFLLELFVMILR